MKIETLSGSNFTQMISPTTEKNTQNDFQGVLDVVMGANQNQVQATNLMTSVLNGESDNTHGAMIALEKSSVQLQVMTKVRDELINGYKEIMRVQI